MARWPQALIMSVGSLIVLIGLALVAFPPDDPASGPLRANEIRVTAPGTTMFLTTQRPGITLIIAGSILLIVGFISSMPWRR